jgi:metal-responsive CopG/Arc/MetJ family transcriptional regulator
MLDMGRDRKPINLTLDPEVVRRLDAWIEKQPIKTARSAVVEAAVQAFLDQRETKRKGSRE